MDKCNVCGAPVDSGKCTYCGAVSQQTQQSGQQTQHNYQQQSQQQNTYQNQQGQQGYPQQGYPQQGYPSQPIVIQHQYAPAVSPKSKTVAGLLCFFLGIVGAHHFYVGRVGMGLLYLFTAGICGVGALIDFIKILIGSFRDSFGMPVSR